MVRARIEELLAIALIGEGVLAALGPERYVRLWYDGPRWWRALLRPFVDHPQLTRWVGIGEVATGLWLASRQRPTVS